MPVTRPFLSGEVLLPVQPCLQRKAADRCDVAVMVFAPEAKAVPATEKEASWISYFQKHGTPVVAVLNKADLLPASAPHAADAGASDAADASGPADTAAPPDAGVPMTNYGVAIAYLKGILDKVETGEARPAEN